MDEMKTYDYGNCHVCDTPLKEKMIHQDFWIKGKLLVVDDIPAGVCPQCGEKVVKADIGRHIAGLLTDNNLISQAPTVQVPVIKFEQVRG